MCDSLRHKRDALTSLCNVYQISRLAPTYTSSNFHNASKTHVFTAVTCLVVSSRP